MSKPRLLRIQTRRKIRVCLGHGSPPSPGGEGRGEGGRVPLKMATKLLILAILIGVGVIPMPAADNEAGRHSAAGKEVEQQEEKDWSDSRWNQTDVGPFLASSLQTPGGTVVKALSVKVGSGSEASVCYDLGKPSMRAGWTGGFLKFQAVRFGIMGPPARAPVNGPSPPPRRWVGRALPPVMRRCVYKAIASSLRRAWTERSCAKRRGSTGQGN